MSLPLLDSYCRTCAKVFDKKKLISFYNVLNPAINAVHHYQNYGFQIEMNDGLPQQICSSCLGKFNNMNEFLEVCEESQAKLKKLFSNDASSLSCKQLIVQAEDDTYIHDERLFEIELLDDSSYIFESQTTDATIPPIKDVKNSISSEKIDILSKMSDEEVSENESEILYNNDNNTISNLKIESIDPNDATSSDSGSDIDKNIENLTYSCEFCKKSFKNYQTLIIHERTNHSRNVLSSGQVMCETCGDIIASNKMSSHLKTHKIISTKSINQQEEYFCEICNKVYFNKNALRKHLVRTHLKPNNDSNLRKKSAAARPKANLKCLYCTKLFHNTVTLLNHCKTHSKPGANETRHICNECGTAFKRADHLKIHINAQHSKSKEFKCNFCNKIFYASFVLNRHIKLSHSGKKPRATCDICKKNVADEEYLIRHKKEQHGTEKLRKCPICDESFVKRTELLTHSKIHDIILSDDEQKEFVIKELCKDVGYSKKSDSYTAIPNFRKNSTEIDIEDQIQVLIEYADESDYDIL